MRTRAIALPVVLSVLTLMLVIVAVVASSGILNLQHARVDNFQKQSLYAAEAGIARSIRAIIAGNSGNLSGNFGANSQYAVVVTPGPRPGPPRVPAGCSYLLATGTTGGRFERKVGVLIRGLENGEATSDFAYAVATGGSLSAQGGGRISGSLKSNGNLTLGGGIKLSPVSGNGRLLSSGNIGLGGGVKTDPTQDVRAQGTVTGKSGLNVFSNDNTPASAPFLTDGRFTNTRGAGEVGEVLPNPDPVALLGLTEDGAGDYMRDPVTGQYVMSPARTDVVKHEETVVTGSLDLAGKIHFFPNGVTLDGVSGTGTIVTGQGNKITFTRAIRGFPKVNLLALRWKNQMAAGLGTPDIEFSNGRNELAGLVLAHGNVSTSSNFNLNGILVTFGNFDSSGNRTIVYNAAGLLLPGLESWVTGGAGGVGGGLGANLPVLIVSWQRL